MLLCSWMRRISTLKCQFLKGKKNWMQFLVLTHSLYEGWKWRRIKKCKNLYGRKKMPSTANKQRIKKSIEWFFPSQVAKLTLILSWFKKQLFATPVASGLMILHEGAQLQQSRLHVPPLPRSCVWMEDKSSDWWAWGQGRYTLPLAHCPFPVLATFYLVCYLALQGYLVSKWVDGWITGWRGRDEENWIVILSWAPDWAEKSKKS